MADYQVSTIDPLKIPLPRSGGQMPCGRWCSGRRRHVDESETNAWTWMHPTFLWRTVP